MKRINLLLAVIVILVPYVGAQSPSSLDTLSSSHPRLLFHDSDIAAIRQAIAADPHLQQELQAYKASGEALLIKAPDTYTIGGPEHTLLDTSRDMEGRILLLAGLYRLTGDSRFAHRATQEMLAAAAFPDWYPKHFLDTAEMTAALGIGYDWLYVTLSGPDRAAIHDAIVTKGIAPWLSLMHANQFHSRNNWVQVCHGGETIGALAIAERNSPADLDLAHQVLDYAQPAIAKIMQLFAPDGGFEEGPVYWNYATIYNVLYIAALDSSLGRDFGASEASGFSKTANYHMQSIGPTLEYANFGDADSDAFPAPQMFWFARRFDNPGYAAQERALDSVLVGHMAYQGLRQSSRFAILGLMWEALLPTSSDAPSPPLSASFTRIAQAYMRSGGNDRNAWYVGFKGGDAHASHGHLDLGTFVLDALGERWALDLGADNYGLPGYFGQQRWTYYRMRTEGHNTLTVDGQNQDLDAKAPLSKTGTDHNNPFAIVDLGQAYKNKLTLWRRGVTLVDHRGFLVQDEVTPVAPVDVVWNFHTAASIHISSNGRSAELVQEGVVLEARILSPAAVQFATTSAQELPPQASNEGISNLVIRLPKQASAEKIIVYFSRPGDQVTPQIQPLSTWGMVQ